jgi:hypothetical protein
MLDVIAHPSRQMTYAGPEWQIDSFHGLCYPNEFPVVILIFERLSRRVEGQHFVASFSDKQVLDTVNADGLNRMIHPLQRNLEEYDALIEASLFVPRVFHSYPVYRGRARWTDEVPLWQLARGIDFVRENVLEVNRARGAQRPSRWFVRAVVIVPFRKVLAFAP